MVPKPLNCEPLRTQPIVSDMVARTFGMLAPIAFHDQPMIRAEKVHDVRLERDLSPPFHS